MAVKLTRAAVDIGIVTANAERMLAFYRDALGFPPDGEIRFPGTGVVHRLRCGESVIKLLAADPAPSARAPGGGFTAATGFRYCTLSVANLEEIVDSARAFGVRVVFDPRPLRPGVRAAMIEDPDGNAIELLGA